MSVIFADATCDLQAKTLKKIGVEVINIPVLINGEKHIYNGENFNYDVFYNSNSFEIDNHAYKEKVKRKILQALKTQQDIVFLTPNAKYDISYNIVYPIIKEISKKNNESKIEIVNCNNWGLGYGLIVYEAGIFNSRGNSIAETVSYVNNIKKHVKTYIVPSELRNIKNDVNVVGESIGLKPILEVVNGEFKILKNVKGQQKAVIEFAQIAKLATQDVAPIAIAHGENVKEAADLKNAIVENNKCQKVYLNTINPFMQKYLGNKCLSMSFLKKPNF